ncbi:hypothetical protein SLS53_006555 [Cytospora paraplurivora]|uniref:Amino acid transporter n=1 Tax=Cytospora paraplurivora TaxID=2898453 RepID=A0AAN9U3F1_9PEZI
MSMADQQKAEALQPQAKSIHDEPGLDGSSLDVDDGTAADREDMFRLGKTQELKRNFRFLTIFGFSMILMCTWEGYLSMATVGLVNGGTAGTIWMFLICWTGFLLINTSMAEMASMAPTSGGQYHWVSEFAPRRYQKPLSYVMGWLCVLGWQTDAASVAYLSGTTIQGLIVLNKPDYVFQRWHGTLLTMAVAAFGVAFNTLLARKLPMVEGLVLIVHVFAFFGILVTLWVLSPTSTPERVFTKFNDGGGWGSLGASTLSGITGGILPLIGADAAVHMSEELRDASRHLPRSMVWTTICNGAMGWIMIITICFCVGDLDKVNSSATGYAFIQVFYNSTGSVASATAMSVFVIFVLVAAYLTCIATASRQLFAFARDKGMPFSPWLANVSPKWDLPLNSLVVTFFTTSLLALINIGSPTALNSITSLATNALLSSYITSIGCLIWRRCKGQPLPPSKFGLGAWSLPMNIAAEVFLVFAFVVSFFPTTPHPDAASMNWNILIYGVVAIMSVVFYFLRGRHQYDGPVEYVRKLE